MLRKILFKADVAVGRVARRIYKEDGTDTLRVRMIDAVANFICWLDIQTCGHDAVCEALVEYAKSEREKAIVSGTYIEY